MKANQFEAHEEDGQQIWTRFAEGEARPEMAFPADASGSHFSDFFGVAEGSGAGIAPLPNALLGSRNWGSVRSAFSGASRVEVLSGHAAIGPAVEAISAPWFADQQLVQAVLIGFRYEGPDAARLMLGQFATREQAERLRAALAMRPKLPAYDLIALADIQTGADEVALVVLLYPEREMAAEAAPILVERLEDYRIANQTPSLLATVGGDVTARVFESSDGAYSAAIAILRATPKAEPDPSLQRPGRVFHLLLKGITDGQVDPLIAD